MAKKSGCGVDLDRTISPVAAVPIDITEGNQRREAGAVAQAVQCFGEEDRDERQRADEPQAETIRRRFRCGFWFFFRGRSA